MSRRTFRIWMTANTLVLVGLAGWILKPSTDVARPTAGAPGVAGPSASRSAAPVPTKEALLAAGGRWFGLSAPQVPWSPTEIRQLADRAGARPNMLQYFVTWTEEFRPEAVEAAYRQGALPVVSWEPWAGLAAGPDQPDFALSRITDGDFDEYLTRFAHGVRDQRRPVAIRLAHEMNGNWYPWSERQSGNRRGEYVRAWRHVHRLFTGVGATNVIWIWSPNILRPVPNVSLKALYPGDSYVDWLGVVGYGVDERTAAPVFEPTLRALRTFTTRPVLITETGVQPGSGKAGWITDFFGWLPDHPEVIGFVWFEYSDEQGGTADWRFTATAQTTRAFQTGLRRLTLAPPLPAPDGPS